MTELDINSDVGNIDGSIFSNEDTLVQLVGYRGRVLTATLTLTTGSSQLK